MGDAHWPSWNSHRICVPYLKLSRWLGDRRGRGHGRLSPENVLFRKPVSGRKICRGWSKRPIPSSFYFAYSRPSRQTPSLDLSGELHIVTNDHCWYLMSILWLLNSLLNKAFWRWFNNNGKTHFCQCPGRVFEPFINAKKLTFTWLPRKIFSPNLITIKLPPLFSPPLTIKPRYACKNIQLCHFRTGRY